MARPRLSFLSLGALTAAIALVTSTGILSKRAESAPGKDPERLTKDAPLLRRSAFLTAALEELRAASDPEARARLSGGAFERTALLLEEQLLAKAYVERHREELLREGSVSAEEIRAAYERRVDEFKTPEGEVLPFDRVRSGIHEELAAERQVSAGRKLIAPLYASLKVKRTEAGEKNIHLGATQAIPADTVLATVGDRKVREAEFRSFIDETVPASRRYEAFAKPNARVWMLASYLDVLVLSEAAKSQHLDEEQSFQDEFREALGALAKVPAPEAPPDLRLKNE